MPEDFVALMRPLDGAREEVHACLRRAFRWMEQARYQPEDFSQGLAWRRADGFLGGCPRERAGSGCPGRGATSRHGCATRVAGAGGGADARDSAGGVAEHGGHVAVDPSECRWGGNASGVTGLTARRVRVSPRQNSGECLDSP